MKCNENFPVLHFVCHMFFLYALQGSAGWQVGNVWRVSSAVSEFLSEVWTSRSNERRSQIKAQVWNQGRSG